MQTELNQPKVVIITGSSMGIGLMMGNLLHRMGHRVYGLSRSTPEGAAFLTIPTDLTRAEDRTWAITQILQAEGRIDVLINNAGRGIVGPAEDTQATDIEAVFSLNFIAATQMMNAVLPAMRAQSSGQILNISSLGSVMGLPFRGYYSASKSALDRVTEAMRYEVRPWGIQIATLHLGDIQTNIAAGRVETPVSEPYRQLFRKVYELMNAHVERGTPPEAVADFTAKLLTRKTWKAHYYFGKTSQKIGVPLKWLLPQNFYESLMRKYNGM